MIAAFPEVEDETVLELGAPNGLALLRVLGAFCDTPFANTSEAIATALDIVMQRVGIRTAFLTRIGIGQLDILHVHNDDGCPITAGATVPLENVYCQYVRATDAPVVIPNSALDARVQQLPVRTELGMASYIGVPIHLHTGELFGTLCGTDPDPHVFNPEHVELMRVLAQRLASLIEQDVLEQRLERVQHETKAAIAAARQTLEQQSAVMSIVAHDLRTPLTSMRGFVELMVNDVFGPVWPKQREALDRVRANLEWMQRLSNDIIDVTSLDMKTFTMLTSEFNPAQIAQNVVDLCQIQASDRGLNLQLAGVTPMQPIIGDADRVQQVLLNLVSNALRYTERGQVAISVQSHADGVEFRIRDTGPGIAADKQEAIWQRGFRASTKGRGTGLGLYVVKQLVNAMCGSVGVESQLGQGSTFWVRIPTTGPAPHAAAWE